MDKNEKAREAAERVDSLLQQQNAATRKRHAGSTSKPKRRA